MVNSFWSEGQEQRFLSLKKDDLDRAHKDKNHKKFPKDFQVTIFPHLDEKIFQLEIETSVSC